MIRVAQIFRFPVKGLGEESLAEAEVKTGAGIPNDRRWAIAHAASPYDAAAPEHISRRHFVQTASTPDLARTTTRLEGDSTIKATHPNLGSVTAELATSEGADALCAWAETVAGAAQVGPYRLAEVPNQAMWDVAGAHLSLMSKKALEILSQKAGSALEMRRFRGNIWLDGFAPGEEFDLVGKEISLGGLRLRVTEPTGRCNAPAASPTSGRRDVPVTEVLHTHYGHTNFGVYAEVLSGGRVAVGDELAL